jgi:hypothetical protein
MTEPRPSNNDPAPEDRKGDSSFLPVVIAFAISILVILIAAAVYIKIKQSKAIPAPHDPHPTSRLLQPQPKASSPFEHVEAITTNYQGQLVKARS